ncbi:MAG: TIGR04283 family arsenosugar biosynthesis glycosyltransferase [Gammaproteobacteria bacterium]|nr:TIGR04283 family arsenosugar biosynthesis glycosyltransferase [Gammaproteobacteria bacterium]MDH5802858.1 TIGR04283 family arsenosugar biosynthesis glycosyltransferase [Gammaproteobacteria bacterium]
MTQAPTKQPTPPPRTSPAVTAALPELSVVIPTLNEQGHIETLLKSLCDQEDVVLQIIVADGGSNDDTLRICHQWQNRHPNIHIIPSGRGRALQMNTGVKPALASMLLFLHADTHIEDTRLCRHGLAALQQRQQHTTPEVAGHFKMRFLRQQTNLQWAYYFYECKTGLNRMDTVNGDQGMLISRDFFQSLGGFDESLPYMEDARLARRIFEQGNWITLPGTVYTSARRFETEGLKQRQILNAILCNFMHIGFLDFFPHATQAYQQQDKTQVLRLFPFLKEIHKQLMNKGWIQAANYWYATGAYVAGNCWQLFYFRDCQSNFKRSLQPGTGPSPRLDFYDRWLAGSIRLAPAKLLATGLTLLWFYMLLFASRFKP